MSFSGSRQTLSRINGKAKEERESQKNLLDELLSLGDALGSRNGVKVNLNTLLVLYFSTIRDALTRETNRMKSLAKLREKGYREKRIPEMEGHATLEWDIIDRSEGVLQGK